MKGYDLEITSFEVFQDRINTIKDRNSKNHDPEDEILGVIKSFV